MTKEEIIAKVNEVLSEEFEVEVEAMEPDASLKGVLGLDSLDLVDVVVLIEQNFGVAMKAADFALIKTFGDFYDFIYTKVNG